MGEQILDAIEVETGSPADACVIWLHGLGADGHDFEAILPELALPSDVKWRFVFPHAPIQPVTINGGMAMRSWYDIVDLEDRRKQDEAGIRESEQHLRRLIARENERGIDSSRIVLAGFSQGGAVVLQTLLRYEAAFAGALALSTYLPLDWTLETEAKAANKETPVLMAHGVLDPVVPMVLGAASQEILSRWNSKTQWKTYPMPHSVCMEEITDIRNFLISVLAH